MTDTQRLDPTILREYDIRGIVDESLSVADVRAIGRALGTLCVRQGGTNGVVGYDGRESSPAFADAMSEGLSSCGLRVTGVGLGPTPMLYYAGKTMDADVAVMISGSHNPPEYNGIKIMMGGKPFFGADIQTVGQMCADGDFVAGQGAVSQTAVFDTYVDRLFADFQPGKDLKVAWDAGNGSAGDAMTALTNKLPGEHILLYADIDGAFPNHHPDPTVEKNLVDLKKAVADNGCDLGIAFDGDGDRIGVVDSQGRVLWGDQLMMIWARDVLAQNPGATIIADVKASQALFDEIDRLGGVSSMWKTGHSLIKQKMSETGSPLAGEMSGHIFFADKYYGFDDALYAAVRLLSILANGDDSLDALRDAMPKLVNTPELRFDCAEDRKFTVIDEVKARLQGRTDVSVNATDGVRVLNDDGWWLLRASNTQAVLVARCESASDAGLENLKTALVEQLEASGLAAPSFE